jgi:hypothetical protein
MRILFSVLSVSCLVAPLRGQDTNSEREKDVYAIYSLMLTNPQTSHGPYISGRYLIAMATGPARPQEPCVRPPREREADFREVLADFESRKSTPRQLKPILSIGKPYVLLSTEEVSQFMSARRFPRLNADAPDERFRGVSDLLTLSEVYFDQRGTLALTAMSTWCGPLCALYQWKVFEKLDDGKWEERRWTTCRMIAKALNATDSRSLLDSVAT